MKKKPSKRCNNGDEYRPIQTTAISNVMKILQTDTHSDRHIQTDTHSDRHIQTDTFRQTHSECLVKMFCGTGKSAYSHK